MGYTKNFKGIYVFNIAIYDKAGYVPEFKKNFGNIIPKNKISGQPFITRIGNNPAYYSFSNRSDGYSYSTDSCIIVLD